VSTYLSSSTLFLLVALNKAARGTDGRTTASLAWPVLRRPALLCALSVPLCHGAHVLDCWLRCSRVSRPLSLSSLVARHRRLSGLSPSSHPAWCMGLLLAAAAAQRAGVRAVATLNPLDRRERRTFRLLTTAIPSPSQHTTDDDDEVGHKAPTSICTL
jgi:hypothetical protein